MCGIAEVWQWGRRRRLGECRCWCCGSGAGARSVSWGLVEAGQREDAGGPRAEAGLGGRRGGCGDGAGGKLT